MSYFGLLAGRSTPRYSSQDTRSTQDTSLLTSVREQWDTIRTCLDLPGHRMARGGLSDTGIAACMDHLANLLVTEDQQIGEAFMGPCMEFILEQDVLEGLMSLCLADEPRGVRSAMITTFAHLVRDLRPGFLLHHKVVRVLMQLLHHSIQADGRGNSNESIDAMLDLVCDLVQQLVLDPRTLQFFVEVGSVYAAGETNTSFAVLSYILRHLHHGGHRGFRTRSAALSLLQGMLAIEPCAIQEILESDLAEALATSTAASYGLLPMQFTNIQSLPEPPIQDQRAFKWQSVLGKWASLAFSHDILLYMDLLWLTQRCFDLFANHAKMHPGMTDQLEYLRADLLEHFQDTFLSSVVHPSIVGCTLSDENVSPALLYSAILYEILEPCGELAFMVFPIDDNRSLNELVTECITSQELSMETRILSIRFAGLFARRIQLREASRGTQADVRDDPTVKSVLGALVQSMQSSRMVQTLFTRSVLHLREVEMAMKADLDYHYASRFLRQGQDLKFRLAILQEPIDLKKHFMGPLCDLLCDMFSLDWALNVEVTRSIASLCRSPYISLEGTLFSKDPQTLPLLMYILYFLVQHAHAYSQNIPDFDFYLGHRRKFLLMAGKLTTPSHPKSIVHPFANGTVDEILQPLQERFQSLCPIDISFKEWYTVDYASSTTSPRNTFFNEAGFNGAEQISISVCPATFPHSTSAPKSNKTCPLPQVLDNLLILEEFLLELAAIKQLREAWGEDII
ncbi:hypothetical protein MPSI1_002809 [Malassezia psittaci]|uniref:FHF complex subunit HOOK-interacting protein C-terminal domain-containing protein n=1 Tax=Malassezia psittaci TaxID=1821823 RepID=A0AAF0JEX4_9BASI|nr:hypothetical protein MPSI1_002809 [Malassezia psittaci]